MNTQILYFFFHLTQSHTWLKYSAIFFSEYAVYIFPVLIVLYIFKTEKKPFQKSLYLTIIVVSAVLLTDYLLKDFFAIVRPFNALGYTPLISESGFSFPSGHATLAGALFGGTYFSISKHPWFTVGVGVLCLAIALSRIMLGVHYPLDVLGGLIWGIVVSFIGYEIVLTYI